MALQNQISISFTPDELKKIDDALTQLESVFAGKLIQLTAEQNRLYGRIGNETGNWIEMVYSDCKATPDLVPAKVVDTAEWDKDETARGQITPRLNRMEALADNLSATNRLIGFDLYNTCLSVYNSVKYEAKENVPGTKAYADKWGVQFPGHGNGKTKKPASEAVK